MRTLTCIHHPTLRWLCKNEGVNADGSYNGRRSIFYVGTPVEGPLKHSVYNPATGRVYEECRCPPSDLRFAPDDQPY